MALYRGVHAASSGSIRGSTPNQAQSTAGSDLGIQHASRNQQRPVRVSRRADLVAFRLRRAGTRTRSTLDHHRHRSADVVIGHAGGDAEHPANATSRRYSGMDTRRNGHRHAPIPTRFPDHYRRQLVHRQTRIGHGSANLQDTGQGQQVAAVGSASRAHHPHACLNIPEVGSGRSGAPPTAGV